MKKGMSQAFLLATTPYMVMAFTARDTSMVRLTEMMVPPVPGGQGPSPDWACTNN